MAFSNGGSFRLQIYDDGAGMYLFDSPLDNGIGAGNQNVGTSGLASGAVGPFILPTPCAVTAPGLLTIQMSNVNTPLNTGFEDPNEVVALIGLVFAVPKKCKGQVPNGMRQVRIGPKGVIG